MTQCCCIPTTALVPASVHVRVEGVLLDGPADSVRADECVRVIDTSISEAKFQSIFVILERDQLLSLMETLGRYLCQELSEENTAINNGCPCGEVHYCVIRVWA